MGAVQIQDDFASDPFPTRWQRSAPNVCFPYNSGTQLVEIGDIVDLGLNCGSQGRIRSVETFSWTEEISFTMEFKAMFEERSGATGGPGEGRFGVGSTSEFAGDDPQQWAAMSAQIDFTNNCVKIRGFFRFSDASSQIGSATACTLSYNVQYNGQIRYNAASATLEGTLGSLSFSLTKTVGKTFTINRPIYYTDDTLFQRISIDDVNLQENPPGGEDPGGPDSGKPIKWIFPPFSLEFARIICRSEGFEIRCQASLLEAAVGVEIMQTHWYVDGSYAVEGSPLSNREHIARIPVFAFPIRTANVTVQIVLSNEQILSVWSEIGIDNVWILVVIGIVLMIIVGWELWRFSRQRARREAQ